MKTDMNKTIDQPELWTGSFVRICLVNFFIFVNFHALLPTFPFFVTYLRGGALGGFLARVFVSLQCAFTLLM